MKKCLPKVPIKLSDNLKVRFDVFQSLAAMFVFQGIMVFLAFNLVWLEQLQVILTIGQNALPKA